MEIRIKKGKSRNTITCKRADGSTTRADLGPNIPHHDIAHYVVEKRFDLEDGFYGKIKSGKSIEELSDKEVIKELGPETWLSEIMARNLQSISSEAAKTEQFIELVTWEVQNIGGIRVPNMGSTDVEKMKSDFDQLCEEWNLLGENGELELIFE